jgi:type IV pilus assembly protein PilC
MNSARMARTLGVLIKSGVPIVQGIGIVSGTLSNQQFRASLEKSAQEVQKGQALSQSLKNYPDLYPPIVEQMVEVGEETGTTDQILLTLAEFYEEEINNTTKNLSSIIEPVLMIIIGVVVGFFAISMLTPMYSLMEGM